MKLFTFVVLFIAPSLFAQKSSLPVATVPSAAIRPAGCDPNKFLTKAYQDLLGRRLDAGGTAYWLGVMKNGANRTQVASQLIHSAEAASIRVRGFYNSYLHRPANGSEVSSFAGMLQQGGSEQVEATILASPEYFSGRGGGTNPGFVGALYQDLLGRPADPQGVAMFTQQISTGASRAAIAQQVLNSAEARQRRINALYTRYLHRPASGPQVPGGIDQVAAAIIGSEEYCRQ